MVNDNEYFSKYLSASIWLSCGKKPLEKLVDVIRKKLDMMVGGGIIYLLLTWH